HQVRDRPAERGLRRVAAQIASGIRAVACRTQIGLLDQTSVFPDLGHALFPPLIAHLGHGSAAATDVPADSGFRERRLTVRFRRPPIPTMTDDLIEHRAQEPLGTVAKLASQPCESE